jgi:hypothetical protein
MRPPVVVVCHVLAEHPDQVSLIDDYEVIEALSAQCAYYPFGNRVRLWCSQQHPTGWLPGTRPTTATPWGRRTRGQGHADGDPSTGMSTVLIMASPLQWASSAEAEVGDEWHFRGPPRALCAPIGLV